MEHINFESNGYKFTIIINEKNEATIGSVENLKNFDLDELNRYRTALFDLAVKISSFKNIFT